MWVTLALIIPVAVGLAVAAKAPVSTKKESRVVTVLRGFPITLGLASAFLIMFVSVPVMRLATIVRRRKSADIPLITHDAAYHQVAVTICEVLNRHGFSLRRASPGWWVAAPTRILGLLGRARHPRSPTADGRGGFEDQGRNGLAQTARRTTGSALAPACEQLERG